MCMHMHDHGRGDLISYQLTVGASDQRVQKSRGSMYLPMRYTAQTLLQRMSGC
jgi:hypothetical protein